MDSIIDDRDGGWIASLRFAFGCNRAATQMRPRLVQEREPGDQAPVVSYFRGDDVIVRLTMNGRYITHQGDTPPIISKFYSPMAV
jgi:hypothetical protein